MNILFKDKKDLNKIDYEKTDINMDKDKTLRTD